MNAKEFVACWRKEKESLLDAFMDTEGESAVAHGITSLELKEEQQTKLKEIVEGILTDTLYSLLLGLDGAASIGEVQADYTILDGDGNVISPCGELEEEAWEQFYETED